jgi:anti-anti-sigma factor
MTRLLEKVWTEGSTSGYDSTRDSVEREWAMSDENSISLDEDSDTAVTQEPEHWAWVGTLFCLSQIGQTLIIAPRINGNRFRYARLQTEVNALRQKLDQTPIRGLILDLHALNYLGSEAIGGVVTLARKAEEAGARVALCSAEPPLLEAITNMGLHRIWPLYATCEEAIDAVEKNA